MAHRKILLLVECLKVHSYGLRALVEFGVQVLNMNSALPFHFLAVWPSKISPPGTQLVHLENDISFLPNCKTQIRVLNRTPIVGVKC